MDKETKEKIKRYANSLRSVSHDIQSSKQELETIIKEAASNGIFIDNYAIDALLDLDTSINRIDHGVIDLENKRK